MKRKVYICKEAGLWFWACYLCEPPTFGCTSSFEHTVRNVKRHCTRTRAFHHAWVRQRLGVVR